MKKSILFDLDGTLTDSGEGIINCAKMTLERFGLPIPSPDELRTFVGPPLGDSFMKYGVPADRVEEAIAVFRSRYLPIGKFENTPYPGIRETLAALQKGGWKLYVATSKPEVTAVEILEHFDLAKCFVRICGADMGHDRENKSDVIAYLLAQGARNGIRIMVGDTKYDVLGAAQHGIPTIGVSWGYGDVQEMKDAGARAIVDTPQALFALVEKLGNPTN